MHATSQLKSLALENTSHNSFAMNQELSRNFSLLIDEVHVHRTQLESDIAQTREVRVCEKDEARTSTFSLALRPLLQQDVALLEQRRTELEKVQQMVSACCTQFTNFVKRYLVSG